MLSVSIVSIGAPGIVVRFAHHAGTDWVPVDVAHGDEELIAALDKWCFCAVLKNLTCALHSFVDEASQLTENLLHEP